MDGTLLDTEGPARAAFAKAIVEVGFEFDAVVYDRCLGTTFAETQEILVAAYGKGLDTEELQRAWTANFFVIRDSANLKIGTQRYYPQRKTILPTITISFFIDALVLYNWCTQFFVYSIASRIPSGPFKCCDARNPTSDHEQ